MWNKPTLYMGISVILFMYQKQRRQINYSYKAAMATKLYIMRVARIEEMPLDNLQ